MYRATSAHVELQVVIPHAIRTASLIGSVTGAPSEPDETRVELVVRLVYRRVESVEPSCLHTVQAALRAPNHGRRRQNAAWDPPGRRSGPPRALLVHPQHGALRESRLTQRVAPTHFRHTFDGYGRPRTATSVRGWSAFRDRKAWISSEKARSERERSMAGLTLTMEVLYQLS